MTRPAHRHLHLSGDDDEVGVSFDRFEIDFKWLYFQSVDDNCTTTVLKDGMRF